MKNFICWKVNLCSSQILIFTSFGCIGIIAYYNEICQEGNEFDAKLFPDIGDDI